MKTVTVTTPVKLTTSQLAAIKANLKLQPSAEIIETVDPGVIAGIIVEIDGTAINMTVKHQLAEIAKGSL
jgi:F0F1-type ATP synthase delta subunit